MPTSGFARAIWVTTRETCRASAASDLRNFRRAGTLKNRSATSTMVPSDAEASLGEAPSPPSTRTSVPWASPRARVRSVNRETDAMLGSASPRKPFVAIALRSSIRASLLVAWRSRARAASSAAHPVAVVLDADEPLAALLDGDRDPRGTGVEGVLDQLLDDGYGTLDHLAGRDLVGKPGRQPVDLAHRLSR